MYCLPICKKDPDEHIGNIFLSGGIEHGSKGNELLGLHLLYLLGQTSHCGDLLLKQDSPSKKRFHRMSEY